MVNFWENDKNISPPYDLWEKMWGDDVGKLWGKIVGRDDLVRGDIFGKVGVDRGGCGRKFLAHATLFLMVPKCQSTPPSSVYIYHRQYITHISFHV